MPRRLFEGEARKVALNMKTTADVRERLEAAALASGRSLTHEVEFRIQSSLDQEYLLRATFGDGFKAQMFQRMAEVTQVCRRFCKEHSFSEIQTRQVISAACIRVVTIYCWSGGALPQEEHRRIHGKSVPRHKMKPEHIGIEIADTTMTWEGDDALDDLDKIISNHWSGDGKTDEWKADGTEHGNPAGTVSLKDIMGR